MNSLTQRDPPLAWVRDDVGPRGERRRGEEIEAPRVIVLGRVVSQAPKLRWWAESPRKAVRSPRAP